MSELQSCIEIVDSYYTMSGRKKFRRFSASIYRAITAPLASARISTELEPDLADRLAKSLQLSGISLAEMAAYMEVHRNSVGGWLNGRSQPSPANVRLWAIRTGVPYVWLRYGTWPEEESEQVNT
jgi:DNA-binding transcriptional regulator YiaG